MIYCRKKKNTPPGFFLIEISIAILLSALLSSIILHYVGMLIMVHQDINKRTNILNQLQSTIVNNLYTINSSNKVEKKPWGTLKQTLSSGQKVIAQLPFSIHSSLRSFSLIHVEATWKSADSSHSYALIAGRCS